MLRFLPPLYRPPLDPWQRSLDLPALVGPSSLMTPNQRVSSSPSHTRGYLGSSRPQLWMRRTG